MVVALASSGSTQAIGGESVADEWNTLILADGVPLDVRFPDDLLPGKLREGDSVALAVARDVRVGDRVVILQDTAVRARVEAATARRPVGFPAEIRVVVLATTAVDGTAVPLSGVHSVSGEERHVESMAFAWSVCCLGLFVPGEDASIASGTIIGCFVEGPVEVRFAVEEPDE